MKLKRVSKIKIQSNSRKEGKAFMKQKDINIKGQNTKQRQQRRKETDELTKKSIQDEDTEQHHERRENLDEATKKNIQAENTKQYQKRRKYTKME